MLHKSIFRVFARFCECIGVLVCVCACVPVCVSCFSRSS